MQSSSSSSSLSWSSLSSSWGGFGFGGDTAVEWLATGLATGFFTWSSKDEIRVTTCCKSCSIPGFEGEGLGTGASTGATFACNKASSDAIFSSKAFCLACSAATLASATSKDSWAGEILIWRKCGHESVKQLYSPERRSYICIFLIYRKKLVRTADTTPGLTLVFIYIYFFFYVWMGLLKFYKGLLGDQTGSR